jgi:DNA primase
LKDPADILQKFGQEILKNITKYCIIDFEYLIFRSRSLNDVLTPEGKNRALALLFPYFEALESEIERDSCIEAAANAFGVDRNAVRSDYLRRHTRDVSQQEVPGKPPDLQNRQIRMNGELFPLIVVSVNPNLYPEFRKALEIREVEDPAARELFVALEECFVNDESSIDDLLARIKSESLRSFIADRGTSPEFGSGQDPRRLMEDGIKSIRKTKLVRRLNEISAQLRNCERGTDSVNLDELLAEKMMIDSQIRKLEGR